MNNETEEIKRRIHADMLQAKAHYQHLHPEDDWELTLFAAWSAAAREAEAWRQKATVLTLVVAGLCALLIWNV